MKESDRYISILWAALGLYLVFEGYRLKLGTFREPGPGFLIFCAGVSLSALSMALFFHTYFSKEDKKRVSWKGLQWPKVIKLMTSLLVYALVFKSMGFLVSTFLLLLFLFKGLEPQRWAIALVLSTTVIALCYLVFVVFLEFHFPEGILGIIFTGLR